MTSTQAHESPYLPGTQIQFAYFCEVAGWLTELGTRQGTCLICHLAPNAKGYSPVSFGRKHKLRAHRVVYMARHGYIPDDIMVLHTCDTRNCIEISHLFKGTAQDNTDDMIAKGRKVDDPDVGKRRREATWNAIKPLLEQGFKNNEIARRLCISPSTVGNYVSGRMEI